MSSYVLPEMSLPLAYADMPIARYRAYHSYSFIYVTLQRFVCCFIAGYDFATFVDYLFVDYAIFFLFV